MAMEWVRSSIAALLFLTLVALAAASASGGDDAAAVEEQQCRPLANEPYMPQLGAALANTKAAADADDEQVAGYMLVGMQTGGIGDKIRLVVVADRRYFSITGNAKGLSSRPRWSFRDGERHRLLPLGSRSGRSHAEVVASNVLRALMDDGSSCA